MNTNLTQDGEHDLDLSQLIFAIAGFLISPDREDGFGIPLNRVLVTGAAKTNFADIVAFQANAALFVADAAQITSHSELSNQRDHGASAQEQLRQLFTDARAHQPAVILIDSIDQCALSRVMQTAECSAFVCELLTQIQALSQKDAITVLLATDQPEELDGAISNRFALRVDLH
jgi:AAA+ superfamily predicted ATPase